MEISPPQASQLTTSYYASISISVPDLNSITRRSAFTIIFSRSPRTKSSLYSLTSCVISFKYAISSLATQPIASPAKSQTYCLNYVYLQTTA